MDIQIVALITAGDKGNLGLSRYRPIGLIIPGRLPIRCVFINVPIGLIISKSLAIRSALMDLPLRSMGFPIKSVLIPVSVLMDLPSVLMDGMIRSIF